VTVALTGDGADELFFGYRRYVAARLMRRYGLILRRIPLPLIRGAGADSLRGRLHRMSEAAQANGYSDLRAIFPQPLLSQLMPNSPPRLRDDVGDAHSPEEAASRARRFDVGTYLPDDILRKTDTAAMAVALETRAPFLEPELATAALVAGPAALMPRGQRKGLLRQVARKYLPAEIVDRPKQGFAIPIGEWFRTDYGGMKQLLMDHLNSTEPWGPPSLGIDLNMTFVRRMLDEHMSERRDHSQRLYMLLVLSIWAKWLGGL
jgi:asparagine synthase (glutamine-hydrolysing)